MKERLSAPHISQQVFEKIIRARVGHQRPANKNSRAESSSALKHTAEHASACFSFEPEDFIFRPEAVRRQEAQSKTAEKEQRKLSPASYPRSPQEAQAEVPAELPILPLRGVVVYPLTVLPLTVGQSRSIQLVDEAVVGKRIIGLTAAKDPSLPEPGPEDVYRIGTAAVIHRLLRVPDGTIRLIVQGIERIKIENFIQTEPYLKARVAPIPDIVEESMETEALMRNLVELFRRLVSLIPHLPDELMLAALNVEDPRQLTYLIATSIRMNVKKRRKS